MRSGSRSSRRASLRSRVRALRSRAAAAMVAALAIWVGLAGVARADGSDDRRGLVMLRVLAYDNHLRERGGDEVGIVIVYPAGDGGAAERARWTAAFATARKLKVDGRPGVVTAHKFATASGLGRALRDLHAVALSACDGLAKAIAVGDLSGTVTDPSSAAVPNATVSATNRA